MNLVHTLIILSVFFVVSCNSDNSAKTDDTITDYTTTDEDTATGNDESDNNPDVHENESFDDSENTESDAFDMDSQNDIDEQLNDDDTSEDIDTCDITLFAGGSGTVTDPLQVETPEQLNEIRNCLKAHFVQNNDISLKDYISENGEEYNDGEGWRPIGERQNSFEGQYNGQGFTISGLSLNRSEDYQGLFGSISVAKIKNLTLTEINVEGYNQVGSIVGISIASTIENCKSSGLVIGQAHIGGLVGENYYKSSISDSSFEGAILSRYGVVGGIVGSNDSSTVRKCFSHSDITTSMQAGGIVGIHQDSILENSYSTGIVHSSEYGGGLVGWSKNSSVKNCYCLTETQVSYCGGGLIGGIDDKAVVENCFSAGKTDGGGLIGCNNDSEVKDSFWDVETSMTTDSEGGTGKTNHEMKTLATFINANWDFVSETDNGSSDYWNIDAVTNDGYPYLVWQSSD